MNISGVHGFVSFSLKLQALRFCFVEDADQRFENLETRAGKVEDQVHSLTGNFEMTIVSTFSLIYGKKTADQRFELVKAGYVGRERRN